MKKYEPSGPFFPFRHTESISKDRLLRSLHHAIFETLSDQIIMLREREKKDIERDKHENYKGRSVKKQTRSRLANI